MINYKKKRSNSFFRYFDRFSHQLNIVNYSVPETFEGSNSISVKREGHTLQSLLFGVHTDVRLHLNTMRIPQLIVTQQYQCRGL